MLLCYSFMAENLCKMCASLGDACRSGTSQKSSLHKSYNKSLITPLIQCCGHINVPSIISSLRFAVSAPRCFSSQSGDEDGVNDSDAGANYYKLYQRLMTQSQTVAAPSSSSVGSSLSTESSRTADVTLSHVGESGKAKMVDVGSKPETSRVAVAAGRVKLGGTAFELVAENRLKKGDVLSTAQLAGIMAVKQTSHLIPLCHNVVLTSVDVNLTLESSSLSVVIECTARSRGQTGVEMEALTGVAVAALTVYDMCKSVSHDIIISDVQLISKTGGKSDFCR